MFNLLNCSSENSRYNPHVISGALFTLRIQYTQTQCDEGARDGIDIWYMGIIIDKYIKPDQKKAYSFLNKSFLFIVSLIERYGRNMVDFIICQWLKLFIHQAKGLYYLHLTMCQCFRRNTLSIVQTLHHIIYMI